jgi:uncharacterized membrane protein YgcG
VRLPGPTVTDERTLVLRARKLPVPDVGWQTNGVLWSLLLFGLTTLALAATFWLAGEVQLPRGLVTGALALTVAEMLIGRWRFFGTGVESALWIGGLFALIFGLPGSGKPEVFLLFAAAAALAGFRVRNPLFGAGAAVLVVVYLAERRLWPLAAGLGVTLSLAALAALARELRRPSTEMLFSTLLVVPPIAGAIASAGETSATWAVVYLAAACVCAVSGIRMRAHAPLIAAGAYVAIAIVTLAVHDLLPWPREWRLMAGGAALLALAAGLSRILRRRRAGIVVTPDRLTPLDEALEIGGTLALQPRSGPAAPTRESGGRFGGGGASGHF